MFLQDAQHIKYSTSEQKVHCSYIKTNKWEKWGFHMDKKKYLKHE